MTQSATPAASVMIDIYRRMALIKQNDERFLSAIKAGNIVAPYYSPRGQEAIPAAVSVNLEITDYICTIYRGFHDMLAKGVPMNLLWAEVAGRTTGTCKGKGGPMHITHPETGVMVTTGIVGSSMPIANGLALASQIRKDKRVTVAYFGDGASNIGAFHESLNLASIWNLPVVFVCQNNGYGEHTRYAVATAAAHVADRAPAYQMPGVTIDGNDPLAVYGAAKTAVDRARAGDGPTLIEATTFRFNGHVFGDADVYMHEGEKAAAMKNDPVPKFRAWLIAKAVADEATLAGLDAAISRELDAAVAFALASPVPDSSELGIDVFAEEVTA